MSRTATNHHHLDPKGVDRLGNQLSGRDLAIIGQVSDLRLMSARQITTIHFKHNGHDNDMAAARASQRVLARLARDGFLIRLDRQIGGVRAGSAGYVYGLGSAGQRALGMDGPRKRRYEPSLRFLDHTLAISQLVVEVTTAARSGACEILACQAEPRCHREFSGMAGRVLVRPDLFLALGVKDFEHRWFVEIDRGTESVPVIIGKCRIYDAYYQSGREQAVHGVFPRVCWIVPDERRVAMLRRAITQNQHLDDRLFTVTTANAALTVLTGGKP